jgi:sugar O-acyltransferase (sialic acid O-acetyltransferase NeuD family)
MLERAPSCVLLGGGGHARVLIDALQAACAAQTFGILDPDASLAEALLDVPVLGSDELLPDLARNGTTHFIVAVGSVGDATVRRRLFERALALGLAPLEVRHPSAVVSRWATLGQGVQLLPAAVVNAGACIGANVIVNTGAIVEHDCRIGDHVHIATGARLASTVDVGAGAHVGAGAVIRQSISIGAEAVVGAGAVVVKDVPPGTVVAGVPAVPLRRAETHA